MRIAPDSFAFTCVLGLFAALPPLSIDISAPALALLPEALGTSRTIAGLTLSLFMVGFAMGQLAGGSLSDRHGRRPVLLAGLCLFTVAGIACAVCESGSALVVSRLIQGTGAGTCSVISFAIIQDLFTGEAARAKRSYVTVIFGGVPILAPALGAAMISWFGWRSVHWSLAAAGLLMLTITWACIAESKPDNVASLSPPDGTAIASFWSNGRFARLTLANALSYGVIFSYISGAPVVIIGQMGLSPQVFATVFACTAGALAMGAWTSGRLSRWGAGAPTLVRPALIVSSLASFGLAGISLFSAGSEAALLPLILAVLFSRGIIAPNIQYLAIACHPARAGLASAAVGVSQLLLGALASAVVAALLQSHGVEAVTITMAVLAGGASIAWVWANQKA